MSRIHEALQKAEQERRGTSVVEPVAAAVAAGPALAPEADSSAVSMESLRSKCALRSWNSDPGKVIFDDGTQQLAIAIEGFRTLRTRLYQLRETRPLKTVLIASALPQEGKSFVAVNLSQVLTKPRGRSVLLIDADLRWSRVHGYLGAPCTPGLSDYLQGEADEYAVIQQNSNANLFFIPGGKSVQNADELIANGRFKLLIERLSPVFDWIVIDSPAAIPVSDASRIAGFCDGVLMVVKAGETPFPMAQKARKEFQKKSLVGVVLNRVEVRATYSRYYHYGSEVKADAKAV